MNNSHGVVHTFEETPILLTQLLLQNKQTKRSKLLKEKLVYDPPIRDNNRGRSGLIKSKSAFYVLKLPACAKAIKIGRANATSDGIITRLGEYRTKYGNAKILYLRTFTYTNAAPENQPVARFEKKIKEKLRENDIDTIRGNEYYPNDMLNELKQIINNVAPNNEANQPQQVRRSGRNS